MGDDDLLAPAVLADPVPYFRGLQQRGGAHWNARWGGFVVTRYRDVVAALQDPRISCERDAAFAATEGRDGRTSGDGPSLTSRLLARWMVFRDPPDHTRLRTLVNKAFTPRRVEAMRPDIQRTVDALLSDCLARGEFDAIRVFALPLPTIVIARMLGLAPEHGERLKAWSEDLATFVLGAIGVADRRARGERSLLELSGYFRDVLRERRARPRNDLLSALIEAEEAGALLDEDELVATCTLLLFAGHETTMNLIGNALLALARHPEARARLRAEPALIGSAVEELLRFDGPVKASLRRTTEPIEIDGTAIPGGAKLLLVQCAANRDPERFADPDRLHLDRTGNAHLGFGFGLHYCLGAALARAEAQIAIATLLARMPDYRVLGEPAELAWRETILIRGLARLPLAAR